MWGHEWLYKKRPELKYKSNPVFLKPITYSFSIVALLA